MTAPPKDATKIVAGWRERVDAIDNQLLHSRLYRHIFTEVRDAMVAKDQARHRRYNSWFITSYADVYWDSQVMVVRRLTDTDERTHSIPNLVASVRKNRQLLVRQRFIDEYLERLGWPPDTRDVAEATTLANEVFRGEGAPPAELFDDFNTQLNNASETIKDHATTWIAHRDRSANLADHPVTFALIHSALDCLERVAAQLHFLVNGTHKNYANLVIPPLWKLPLMTPIFEPGPAESKTLQRDLRRHS